MHNNIVGKHSEHKKLESNILQISQDAKNMKKQFSDVIDATVGMLHHEDGRIFKYQCIEDLLHELSDSEIYTYASVRGTEAFREGVFNWVFGENADRLKKEFKYCIIPTTGGSGAVSNTFYNFNDFNQKVLLPNFYWSPYFNFAQEANIDLTTFSMYDDQYNFNIADFREKAFKLAKEQDRLTVLLNDPANNPTGLCMTLADWKEVVRTLNEIRKELDVPVTLIQDIAYVDYQMKDSNKSREVFSAYFDLDPEILAVVVFSGSKTFSLYGLRVGAQIGISKSQSIIDDFTRVGDYSVRGRFSSVSQPGINIIGKLLHDQKHKLDFEKELIVARKLLRDRANLFLEEAKKNDLKLLPYRGGFFISILTDNKNIFQDMVKDHAFLIPMQGLVRIAISSLPMKDIPNLVKILKKHI